MISVVSNGGICYECYRDRDTEVVNQLAVMFIYS